MDVHLFGTYLGVELWVMGYAWASRVAQLEKNPPAMQEVPV